MAELEESVLNSEGAIIAYSLPGTTEFITATIGKITVAQSDEKLEDYDWVFAPFDSIINKKILIKITSNSTSRKFSCYAARKMEGSETSKESYNRQFQEAQDLISNGVFQKLVLSRTKQLYFENQDLYPVFISLKNLHPDAFTYLLHIPELGTWLGATPEKLLGPTTDNNYLTRAIAGTLPANEKNAPHWTSKEIDEHQIIEAYLDKALTDKQFKHQLSPSYTIQAGKMAHICSDMVITNDNTIKLDELLQVIHPGPALSGMPKDSAVKRLSEIEDHDRAYYCGYLGPLKGNSGLALFANIRCAEVFSNGIKLYLGGGITAASHLEKEWAETELKAETILAALTQTIVLNSLKLL